MLKEKPLGYSGSALGNYMLLIKSAYNSGFTPHLLGFDTFFPIILFSRKYQRQKSNKCIDVLTHGDEVAPFFALLGLLTILGSELGKDINLSFLLKNPTGFAKGTRNDIRDDNPNRGFAQNDKKIPLIGKLIETHQQTFLKAGANEYLSMHEDSDVPGKEKNGGAFAYIQTGQRSKKTAQRLLFAAAPILGIASNKTLFDLEKLNKENDELASSGIIREKSNSSLDNKLSEKGIPSITTETPSYKVPLALRIAANSKIIQSFAK